MYFHLFAGAESLGSVTNDDLAFAADGVLTLRNSHLLLSKPMKLISAYAQGTTLVRVRFGNISLQTYLIPHIWPLEQSATVPDLPAVDDRMEVPMDLPVDEEITVEQSTNAVGPAVCSVGLWLADEMHPVPIPRGEARGMIRATVVLAAGTDLTWNTPVAIVPEKDPMSGAYAIVGAHVVAAAAPFFRIRFPAAPSVAGKQLRPGGLCQESTAVAPWPKQARGFGVWGKFHTTEYPEIQTFGDAAGGTYEVRLDVVRLGSSRDLIYG